MEDVNDNAPQFVSCPESLSIEENLSPGATVTTLRAVDGDRGIHANIEYFIEVHMVDIVGNYELRIMPALMNWYCSL